MLQQGTKWPGPPCAYAVAAAEGVAEKTVCLLFGHLRLLLLLLLLLLLGVGVGAGIISCIISCIMHNESLGPGAHRSTTHRRKDLAPNAVVKSAIPTSAARSGFRFFFLHPSISPCGGFLCTFAS
jgi:hypothetical protein